VLYIPFRPDTFDAEDDCYYADVLDALEAPTDAEEEAYARLLPTANFEQYVNLLTIRRAYQSGILEV
jgi:hypothetical protein